jgi:hypothetical protein
MKKHLKIVMVEDEQTDAELTERELRRAASTSLSARSIPARG